MFLNRYRKLANELNGELLHIKKTLTEEKERLESLKEKEADIVEAQTLLQQLAEEMQRQAHDKIADIVTRCLEAIFDNPYDFRIVFEKKRGKTEADLQFVRDDKVVRRVGGGVKDVASFALRLACVLLSKPTPRKFLCLDESFHFLHSKIYQKRLRNMLETLSKELGVQIVLVTQNEGVATGKIVEME